MNNHDKSKCIKQVDMCAICGAPLNDVVGYPRMCSGCHEEIELTAFIVQANRLPDKVSDLISLINYSIRALDKIECDVVDYNDCDWKLEKTEYDTEEDEVYFHCYEREGSRING